MARATRTTFLINAIRQGVAVLDALPESEDARQLLEECRALEATLRSWEEHPPTMEQREQMIRGVLALHVAIAKLRRTKSPLH